MRNWYGQIRIQADGTRRLVVKPENEVAGLVRKKILKGEIRLAGISDLFEAKDRTEAMRKFRDMVRSHVLRERIINELVIQLSPFMRRRQAEARGWLTIYEEWGKAAA